VLYRAHHGQRRPWWFASSLSGRFDLPEPAGTCYLATDATAALRERLGPTLAGLGFVRAADVEAVVVSVLSVLPCGPIADFVATRAAQFGMTREISTTTDYQCTQRWAAAVFAAGFAAARYQPRFSTSANAFSFAYFSGGGDHDELESSARMPAGEVAADAGIRIETDPPISGLSVVTPR
jgi:hypothetical protein